MTAVSRRWQTFSHALAFVAGFSAVFVIMGATLASVFGFALRAFLPTFVKIGGVILILFGLQVLGVFGWLANRIRAAGRDKNVVGRAFVEGVDAFGRMMYTEGRIQKKVDRRWGYLSSFVMGVFFSAGWIPCIGPVLSAIYAMAAITATAAQGALLLLVYSLGLGIPFLITGAAMSAVAPQLRRMNRHMGVVSKITGVFLIGVGIAMYMDRLGFLAIFFSQQLGNGLAGVELGANFASVTMPIAFLAGLLSFLSPCVLPLIPAYITYLSGTTMADQSTPSTPPAALQPETASVKSSATNNRPTGNLPTPKTGA
jgi:cytochrome c-type biogenesis protein